MHFVMYSIPITSCLKTNCISFYFYFFVPYYGLSAGYQISWHVLVLKMYAFNPFLGFIFLKSYCQHLWWVLVGWSMCFLYVLLFSFGHCNDCLPIFDIEFRQYCSWFNIWTFNLSFIWSRRSKKLDVVFSTIL